MNDQSHAERLEDELLQLFADMDAATCHALEKIAELDAFEGFAKIGFQSTAHWLNFRVGLSMGAAREHVRVANAMVTLPRMRAAMKEGWLSYSKVRALTRIANPKNEQSLLDMARTGTATQMEKLARKVRMVERSEAEKQVEARCLTMGFDDDGMFYIRGRFLADEGARIIKAIESRQIESTPDKFMAALCARQTTELIVHVEADGSACQVESPRGDRISVSAETSRRAACDASVRLVTHSQDGSILDVGRKTRKIPTALKRALKERDGGCRYPGCPNRMVDAHHITHWADGGETKLSNLIHLCRFHHTQLHEGGFTLIDGTFFDPKGHAITATGEPADHATRDHLSSLHTTPWRGPDWWWRHVNYGVAVEGLLATRMSPPNRNCE